MEINEELIGRLARLSMLDFTEEEKKELCSDLAEMAGFIDKLLELDTAETEPLRYITSNENILRNDIVSGESDKKDVFKNAPHHGGSFFKVPKVFKK